ncbi:MAG TPA: Spy/CpxP family protein refolding chaperone [Ramlibacter sp.]|nr:Spy/CpxP family protein refolding chaperone [Ramlibacter sp.]
MTSLRKPLIAVALLAALGVSAIAQVQPQTPPPPAGARAGDAAAHRGGPRMDPAQRQEVRQLRLERRLAALKLRLQIAPTQEAAWNTWTTALKPPAMQPRPSPVEFERMSTPERIDRIRAMRASRQAETDKRLDATKVFYGTLNADQKEVFDGESLRLLRGPRGGMRGGHHGMHHRT